MLAWLSSSLLEFDEKSSSLFVTSETAWQFVKVLSSPASVGFTLQLDSRAGISPHLMVSNLTHTF